LYKKWFKLYGGKAVDYNIIIGIRVKSRVQLEYRKPLDEIKWFLKTKIRFNRYKKKESCKKKIYIELGCSENILLSGKHEIHYIGGIILQFLRS